MNTAQCAWVERTAQARGPSASPLSPGLVSDTSPDRVAALRAAAEALVMHVGGRSVSVSHEPGPSYTDFGEMRVNLDGSVLEEETVDPDAIERLLGIALHEGGHLLDTELPPKKASSLYRWLHNVIEDERIERKVVHLFPAVAHALARARSDLVRHVPFDVGPLGTLFLLVRAPHHILDRLWTRHETLLLDVIRILEPFPSDPKKVRAAVRRIIQVLPDDARRLRLPPWLHLCGRGARRRPDEAGEGDPAHAASRGGGFRWQGGAGEVGDQPKVHWTEAPPAAQRYDQVRSVVAPEAAELAARLDSLLPPLPAGRMLQGRLDRRRLHASRTDGRVFRGPGARADRLQLALIVDLSASMKGESARLAERVAIVVAEACAALPGTRLYAYGHNADGGSSPVTRITRFGTSVSGPALSLGSLRFGGNNRDAHAIEIIGQDLLALAGPRRGARLALLISDGLPNALEFKGDAAVRATRGAIEWLDRVWGGPMVFAVGDSPVWHSLVAGPYMQYDPTRLGEGLARLMAWSLRKA